MNRSLPYNDNHIIECTCDCTVMTTKGCKHLNCMTTGKRWLSSNHSLRGIDFCPDKHAAPKWSLVGYIECDLCDDVFQDVIAWWLDDDVMNYVEQHCGVTRELQSEDPQVYLCPDCINKIKEMMQHG